MPVSDTLADPVAEPNTWKATVLDPWVDDVADAIAALESGGGAVGDGRVLSTVTPGSTEVTTALQTEITSLSAGDVYVFKAGETYTFKNITPPNNVTIQYHGAVLQLPSGSAAGTPLFIIPAGSDGVVLEGGTGRMEPNGVSFSSGESIVRYDGTNANPIINHRREGGRYMAPVWMQYVRGDSSQMKDCRYYGLSGSSAPAYQFGEGMQDVWSIGEFAKPAGTGNALGLKATTHALNNNHIVNFKAVEFQRMGIEAHWGAGNVHIVKPRIKTTSTTGTVGDRIGISIASDPTLTTTAYILGADVTMPTSSYACIEIADASGSTIGGGELNGGGVSIMVEASENTATHGRNVSIGRVACKGFSDIGISAIKWVAGLVIHACPVFVAGTARRGISVDGGFGTTHSDGGFSARWITITDNPVEIGLTSVPASTDVVGIFMFECQESVARGNTVTSKVQTIGSGGSLTAIRLHGKRFTLTENRLLGAGIANSSHRVGLGVATYGGDCEGSTFRNNVWRGWERGTNLPNVAGTYLDNNYSDNAFGDFHAAAGTATTLEALRSFGPTALAEASQ